MSTSAPVITLSISKPTKIAHIQKWAEIAEAIGLTGDASVEISTLGTISVSRYESHVPWPSDLAEDDG